MHPNHPPSAQELGALRKGCVMDGRMVVPNMVYKDLDFVRVIVSEGRNREVRAETSSDRWVIPVFINHKAF